MRNYFMNPVRPVTLGFRLIGISLAKYGIGLFPQAAVLFDIALHWRMPGSAPAIIRSVPGNDYLLTNAWAAIFAGMLGVSSHVGFYLFQLGLIFVALLIPFALLSLTSGRERPWLLFMLLLGGPQVAVLLNWVGGYDTLSVIGCELAVLAGSLPVAALGWGLLALNHPSLAILAWGFWLPMGWWFCGDLSRRQGLLAVILPLVPIMLGILSNQLAIQAWGGNTSRIVWLFQQDYSYYLKNYVEALPFVAWSVLGGGWLVLAEPRLLRLVETKILFLTAAVAAVLLPLIALDETRVASLALLPALLAYVRHVSVPHDALLFGSRGIWYALAAIAMPTVLVFGRTPGLYGWSWVVAFFD